MKKLTNKYLYLSAALNVVLIILILLALKTSYFDMFLFKKSLPTFCSITGRETTGDLCLEYTNPNEEYEFDESQTIVE